MTAADAFCLSPRDWMKIEESYAAVADLDAEQMLAKLLSGATFTEKKFLALGVMIGRRSVL